MNLYGLIKERDFFQDASSSAVRRKELDRIAQETLDTVIKEPLDKEEMELLEWACNRINSKK